MGEDVKINCTSEKTLPPANLTWYINQQPVGDQSLCKQIQMTEDIWAPFFVQVSEEQVFTFPVQNTTVAGGEVNISTMVRGFDCIWSQLRLPEQGGGQQNSIFYFN